MIILFLVPIFVPTLDNAGGGPETHSKRLQQSFSRVNLGHTSQHSIDVS